MEMSSFKERVRIFKEISKKKTPSLSRAHMESVSIIFKDSMCH